MDRVMLQNLVSVESAPTPAPATLPSEPKRALPRNHHGNPQPKDATSDVEQQPEQPAQQAAPGPQTAARQTFWDPYMNRFRFAASCLIGFGNGMNDAAPGALLPYMEESYNLGYALASLIFVGNAIGFITGAVVLDPLRRRLSRTAMLTVAQLLMAAAYVAVVCNPPFPVLVLAYFLTGLGMSLNLAMSNTFCGGLADSTTALGWLHGSYGIGGTVGPLVATAIASSGVIWSRYYFLTLGLAISSAVLSAWAFWHFEKDEAAMHGPAENETSQQDSTSAAAQPAQAPTHIFTALSSRIVLLGALFIFAYQGAEVSISGWVISFLITERAGDPGHVGYVTAGFWAGITLGRFLLSGPAHRVGEKRFVYAATAGAIVFELLVWLVPNVVGDAVAVAVVGLLLGPVYPCSAAVFMRSMHKHEQVSGLGVISAFGSSGGAAAPFTTGILAQAAGTFVLHPIAIGLFVAMMALWYGLPREEKRDE